MFFRVTNAREIYLIQADIMVSIVEVWKKVLRKNSLYPNYLEQEEEIPKISLTFSSVSTLHNVLLN